MSRRSGLAVACCLGMAVWTWIGPSHAGADEPGAGPSPGGADGRPNILLVIADDWSWPHAGASALPAGRPQARAESRDGQASTPAADARRGRAVATPAFDRLAAEGVLFPNAFCAAPSCTPSRGAILTGQAPHRLEDGANLWSVLPGKFPCYPDLLEASGYVVGLTGKGWGPGSLRGTGRSRNPAGPAFESFGRFLERVPEGKPFCYWYGSIDPHRPYDPGSGAAAGLATEGLAVPPFLPDTPEVRGDLADYLAEVERFDRTLADILARLEASGRAKNTIVVVTSDNGMPFPRGKANLYDAGSRVPLAIRWPARVAPGRVCRGFVGLADLAPTFLEAAGHPVPAAITGRSLLDVLLGREPSAPRDAVFLERERHANVRRGDLGYPSRAIRTERYLYIRNFRPDRWPAGDPEMYRVVGPFGDIDSPSPTKDQLLGRRDEPRFRDLFRLACAKRPAEELYDLASDPWQLADVAGDPAYNESKARLRAALDRWMEATADPRASGDGDRFDRYPYVGPQQPPPP